jgi:glycosyl hydrolase family 8
MQRKVPARRQRKVPALRPGTVTAGLLIPALALVLVAALAGCAGGGRARHPAPQPRAVRAFLSTYVQPDGRVTRPDQGGDTVSEGQAYGLLLAEVAGDNGAFSRVWRWTHDHLQLPDGLFAYHANAAGQILSRQPASDADLLMAWALLRYRGPGAAAIRAEGRRVAAAVLAHEVTTGPGGTPILAAGPWATGRPASLDPSYWSLTAMNGIASLTGNPRWRQLADGAVALTRHLTGGGRVLPPDWAELTASGVIRAEPAPNGSQPQPQYGLDAQRTVVWFGSSCDAQARQLAARWWTLLEPGDRAQATVLHPAGPVIDPAVAVLPLVASASSAYAAGAAGAGRQLLQRASQVQQKYPTYYGAAWAALGPALLSGTTLGGC